MKLALFVLSTLATVAWAKCPNGCSGHGTCGEYDACTCDRNFVGADCSERSCPVGAAFADNPLGDLDYDGAVAKTVAAESSGLLTSASGAVLVQSQNKAVHESFQGMQNHEAHFYAECSGKGDCNRESGECECFAGYTGSSCQRTTCPNDCSGHGRCRTIGEIASSHMNKVEATNAAEVVTYDGATASNYQGSKLVYGLWDADKQQACVCDAGYSGADCTVRLCPRGDDPLTTGPRYNNGDSADEEDVFTITYPSDPGIVRFEFTFTDANGREHYSYTDYFDVDNTLNTDTPLSTGSVAGKLLTALRQLPNFDTATLSLSTSSPNDIATVSYSRVGGTSRNRPLVVKYYSQITGASFSATVAQTGYGNTEAVECSNRGLCDYSTGICKCFAGYFGVDCRYQTALKGSDVVSDTAVTS